MGENKPLRLLSDKLCRDWDRWSRYDRRWTRAQAGRLPWFHCTKGEVLGTRLLKFTVIETKPALVSRFSRFKSTEATMRGSEWKVFKKYILSFKCRTSCGKSCICHVMTIEGKLKWKLNHFYSEIAWRQIIISHASSSVPEVCPQVSPVFNKEWRVIFVVVLKKTSSDTSTKSTFISDRFLRDQSPNCVWEKIMTTKAESKLFNVIIVAWEGVHVSYLYWVVSV